VTGRDFYVTHTVGGGGVAASGNGGVAGNGSTTLSGALCPDLLRLSQIGAADGPRGRVVRGFFWLLRAWPPRG
jgi:hypothetical protein